MSRSADFKEMSWPLQRPFHSALSNNLTSIETLVVTIGEDGAEGHGECCPFAPYGDTPESVMATLELFRATLEDDVSREEFNELLPYGSVRNGIDCALWDLEAKKKGTPVWKLAGLPEPKPIVALRSATRETPEQIAEAARSLSDFSMFFLKLWGENDLERVAALHAAAPRARIVVDCNSSWTRKDYETKAHALAELNVIYIEQPFPPGVDRILADLPHPVPVCADESCRDARSLRRLVGLYDMVNIKPEKAGGLTEAMKVRTLATEYGFDLVFGAMTGPSLTQAPGLVLAGAYADYAGLTEMLSITKDREPGIKVENGMIYPPPPEVWG